MASVDDKLKQKNAGTFPLMDFFDLNLNKLNDGTQFIGINCKPDSANTNIEVTENGTAWAFSLDPDDAFLDIHLKTGATAGDLILTETVGRLMVDGGMVVGETETGLSGAPNKRIEINDFDNVEAELAIAVGANSTDTSNLIIAVSTAFGVSIVNSKRGAGTVHPFSIVSPKYINVYQTFTDVATAEASGEASGTHYRITTGTTDAKSIVRAIP